MDDKTFEQTYCFKCGTQRCEGIGTEWFKGCKYRWNHDSYDAATEIEKLNKQIMNMAADLKETNRSRNMEYKIEISMNPRYHDSPSAPYFWRIIGEKEDGTRCNYRHGWGKTPTEAWQLARDYYYDLIQGVV